MAPTMLHTLWPALLGILARITLLVLSACVIDRCLKHQSAALRHAVWRATLAAALVTIAASVVLPSWQVAILPAEPPRTASTATAGALGSGAALAPAARDRHTPGRAGRQHAAYEARPSKAERAAGAALVVWLLGASLLLIRTMAGTMSLVQARRRARHEEHGPAAQLTAKLRRELGIHRTVRVIMSEAAVVPHTFGFPRATLVLPEASRGWQFSRLERVIGHELAHVQRGDALECLLMNLLQAGLWLHPGVWLLADRLAATREAACDDVVLLRGARPSDYAGDLLAAVCTAQQRDHLSPGALAFARRGSLEARLRAILDTARPRGISGRTRRTIVGTCAALAIPIGALHPVARTVVRAVPDAPPQPLRSVQVAQRHAEMTQPPVAPLVNRLRERRGARHRNPARPVLAQLGAGRPETGDDARVARLVATLDSICAITNGRTRGDALIALRDRWIEDARFLSAYFTVLDGIPDSRVRATVVMHALATSRSRATSEHARTIIDGLPGRQLRDEMLETLAALPPGEARPH